MEEFISNSPKDTYELAKKIAAGAKCGEIYTLSGDLGAGKTLFAQGFAAGLGIKSHIVSPTFSIMNVYEEGRLPLYHFDMYRIEDLSELFNLGHDEYFYGEGVCLIEWPEMVLEEIPETAIRIRISKNPENGDDYRQIIVG